MRVNVVCSLYGGADQTLMPVRPAGAQIEADYRLRCDRKHLGELVQESVDWFRIIFKNYGPVGFAVSHLLPRRDVVTVATQSPVVYRQQYSANRFR